MGNCLKTQLKEVVQNQNLLKIGEMLVTIEPNGVFANGLWQNTEGTSIVDLVSGTATISVPEGASFPYSVPTTVGNKVTITAGANGAVLKISDKYNLLCADGIFFHQAFTWKEINFFQNLEYLVWLRGANTGTINITGNISDIAEGNNLDTISLSGIVGDISNFGKSRKINVITTYDSTGLFGTLESLVAAARVYRPVYVYGITLSGFNSSGVTFNGELISDGQAIESKKLSWTETTITFNGVTINA